MFQFPNLSPRLIKFDPENNSKFVYIVRTVLRQQSEMGTKQLNILANKEKSNLKLFHIQPLKKIKITYQNKQKKIFLTNFEQLENVG